MVFLGIGIILFVVVYGVLFQISTAVLGAVFTVLGSVSDGIGLSASWAVTQSEVDDLTQDLILLTMALGIVLIVIKSIMVFGGYGRD